MAKKAKNPGSRRAAMAARSRSGSRRRVGEGNARKERPRLTYAVPIAMANLILTLAEGRRVDWRGVAADLAGGVDPDDPRVDRKKKTAKRYLYVLRRAVFHGEGRRELLRLLDKDGREIVPARSGHIAADRIREAVLLPRREERDDDEGDDDGSSMANVLPNYLAFTLLQFLEAVLPEEELKTVWQMQVGKRIAFGENRSLRNYRRKFLAIPFGEKVYNRQSEDRRILDRLVDAIINERKVFVRHRKTEGSVTEYRLAPYTLATYKSGLYVIGRIEERPFTTTFAVDRIEEVAPIRAADGTPERFTYPTEADYDPKKRFKESFGIFVGPASEPVSVRIRIHDAAIAERIAERRFQATQKITPNGDGTFDLTMTVRGATEIEPWVLGWGDQVTLLEPESIRVRIIGTLRKALAAYGA